MAPENIILLIGILLVTFCIVMAVRDKKKRKERGEPTIKEQLEQKKALKIENLTNALKEQIPQDETIVVVVEGSIHTLIMSEGTLGDVSIGSFSVGGSSRPEEKPLRHGDGIFAATDKRLIMYQKKSKGENLRVFGYDTISAVETSRSWRGAQVVISSDEKMRIGDINSQDEAVEQFTEYVRKKQVEDAELSPSEPTPDIADQIRGLAALKDQGILTEEEFNAKKQDLLDRL